jgi:hypothetical protein
MSYDKNYTPSYYQKLLVSDTEIKEKKGFGGWATLDISNDILSLLVSYCTCEICISDRENEKLHYLNPIKYIRTLFPAPRKYFGCLQCGTRTYNHGLGAKSSFLKKFKIVQTNYMIENLYNLNINYKII